jgi:hypothetical protein
VPGFGRLLVEDPRDRLFALRPLADARAAAAPTPRDEWQMIARPLDQGNEGTCVGHGWRHWMQCAPVVQQLPKSDPLATQIYDLATLVDEWDGNERDRQFGTSVRAGAQVLRGLGYINEFAWEYTLDGAIKWLQFGGPLVMGTDWYNSMRDTDTQGYLRVDPASGLAGGHCWVINGYDDELGLFRCINSWGTAWGRRGRFFLTRAGLSTLIAARADMCAAPELRLPKAA